MKRKTERRIDAIYNFDKQYWFNAAGEQLETESNWDFPCPSCHGPSECTSVDVYYEHHECLNCHKQFTVK